MKKLKFLVALVFTLLIVFTLGACGAKKLSAPTEFDVNEENLFTWNKVENAYSYTVEIKNLATGKVDTKKPKSASQSLSDLEEGYYEIRVMSVARGDEYLSSDWSKTVEFYKNYETGCIYTLINNRTEYEITKVGKAHGVVKIEAVYRDNKPVTRIGDTAFRGSTRITEVRVGENVVEIGERAFYNCSKLEKIVLPEKLKFIGESAFNSCRALKEINIPKSITTIPNFAFSYCRALEEIKLHDEITAIGESAFTACSAIKSITIPDSVTTLGDDAFAECAALESVTIGSGVTEIPDNAFYACDALTTVKYSEGMTLTKIGEAAFGSCIALKSISIPEPVQQISGGAFYGCTALETVNIPATVTSVGRGAFLDSKIYTEQIEGSGYAYVDKWLVGVSEDVLKTVNKVNSDNLKAGTEGIADATFAYASTNLSTFTPPASLKYVGAGAFAGCKGLKEVNLTNSSVVTIDTEAFTECAILNRVFLNDGLETIGKYAFAGCSQVTNRTDESSWIPESVTKIGTYAFHGTGLWNNPDEDGLVYADKWLVGYNKENIGTVTVKDGTVGIADYAFYGCDTLQSIINVDDIYLIGEGAFYECTALGTVQLGDDLLEIQDYTFYKCTALRSIGMPSRLKTIGRSAFYRCNALSEVNLKKTKVESIGDFAFYACASLSSVVLSDKMTEIPNSAFYKCSLLKEIEIPGNVTKISDRAFYKCEALEKITLSDGLVEIGDYAFYGATLVKEINLPDTVTDVGAYAFYKCTSATSINIGSSVENIGAYAFYGMESVKRFNIPSNVKTIGAYAFKGGENVTSMILADTFDSVGAHSFLSWKKATFYLEADSVPEGWNVRWNSLYRPVVFGCNLSEDKSYVVSIDVSKDSIKNVNARNPLSMPVRLGYSFDGFTTVEGSDVCEYTLEQLTEVPEGTTVYLIWNEIV